MNAPRGLPRVLSFFDLSVLSSASMGPAYSLASTMGPMVAAAGSATPMALLFLTAIMLCVATAFSRLSRRAPNAGSSYAWIAMAFGRGAGGYAAWLLLLSNFFATLSTAIPAGIYTLDLIAPAHAQDPWWAAVVGAVWIAGSGVLLYVGIHPTALVTAGALLLELGVLGASAIAAALHAPPHAHGHTHLAAPIALSTFGFINAMVLGIWMTDGWEVSASASEEFRADRTASGRGGITGLLLTSAVLVGCMAAYLHLGGSGGFAQHSDDAMSYVGDLLGTRGWRIAIVSTVLISSCAALWTTLLYLSRSVYAMGRDNVLPATLGRLDRRSEPFRSLLAIVVAISACELLAGFSPTVARSLTVVLNASSVFLGLLFAATALACIKIFWHDRAQRLPAVIVPGLGTLALLVLLTATIVGEDTVLRACALGGVILGVPFALWVSGRRAPQAS